MLHTLDLPSIEYICLNLRAEDAREIFATRHHDSPIILAHEAWMTLRDYGRGAVAWHDGRPAGLIGFAERWPLCWEAISFGTDAYRHVAIELLRWGRATARDLLDTMGAHRLQAIAMADHVHSLSFIRACGGRPDGPVIPRYGKGGETFQRYVWLPEESSMCFGSSMPSPKAPPAPPTELSAVQEGNRDRQRAAMAGAKSGQQSTMVTGGLGAGLGSGANTKLGS